MNILSEDEQEKILSKSIKKIKEQTYHINTCIDKNNLRKCLRESYKLLSELRTDKLTPRKYYHLYISAFDVMLNIKNFIAEEVMRGRPLINIYDCVQQAKNVIPRLYLMITVGAIYIEKVPRSAHVILFDMLGIVKQAQNPVKGLFVRNYLLKMVKDKLPDKNNVYVREGGFFEDSLKFLIQNMEEMNRLWIRLGNNIRGSEKEKREKERDELKILVGESINKLSSLESLTKDIYEQQILPKLLKIILDSKDKLSQQYLMECIIHSFPPSYNIKCLEILLETMTRLEKGIDIGNLFMSLMKKIGKFFSDYFENQNEENRSIIEATQNIYPVILQNFESLLNVNLNNNDKNKKQLKNVNNNMTLVKILELINSFMGISVNCAPNDQIFNVIKKILLITLDTLNNQFRGKILTSEEKNKIALILASPVNVIKNIYEMDEFNSLMNYLDDKDKKIISINIIKSLVRSGINKENSQKIDSVELLQKIIKYLQPLLTDRKELTEQQLNSIDYEYEQNIVSKLLYCVSSNNPQNLYSIYVELKNIFSYGGPRRRKYTLPVLINAIISFSHKITICYEYKKNLLNTDYLNNKTMEMIASLDVSQIENDDIFYGLMQNIYKLLNEIFGLVVQENPENGFKLYLLLASQISEILIQPEKFSENAMNYINSAFNIFEEGKFDDTKKLGMLFQIISNLINYKILPNEKKQEILDKIINESEKIPGREDQCRIMLSLAQIYYLIYKDSQKVKDCITKAKRFADFAMTNPKNLNLYVEFLNKLIYFVDTDENNAGISAEQLEDIIELIKGHIRTIRAVPGDEDISYLDMVENYFNRTLKSIEFKKEGADSESLKEFYKKVNI